MAAAAGRPRDPDIDDRILDAASALMAEGGVDRLSFVDVAARAGTTRPAVYRRHADTTSLAVAAIAARSEATAAERTGDPLTDLTAELVAFRNGVEELRGLGLAGAVLGGGVDDTIADAYRTTVVAPRRRRIRQILDDGVSAGVLTAGGPDRDVLVAMCTGSWYGLVLAGAAPPREWPQRTARLVLLAAGLR